MKRIVFQQTILALGVTLGLLLVADYWLPTNVLAQEPSYDQINEVAKELNCPTCAGLNLSDCRTQTCTQWREQIGDLLKQGYSNQEVLDYFVAQYGSQVLQEPPKSGLTLALWVLPFIALLAGGAWLFYTLRGWSRQELAPAVATGPSVEGTDNSPSPKLAPASHEYISQVEKDLGIEEI